MNQRTNNKLPSSGAQSQQHSKALFPRSRGDAIGMLERRIEFRYWPRWSAFWIAAMTALFGLLFSALLWRSGLEEMAWRYPVAILLSYPVLIALLASWSHRYWDDWFQFDVGPGRSPSHNGSRPSNSSSADYAGGGGDFGGAGVSGNFDAPTGFDVTVGDTGGDAGSLAGDVLSGGVEAAASADEAAIVVVPLVLLFALLMLFGGFAFGLVTLIWTAPKLLAHLMLDAGSGGMLGVHARPSQRESWLSTAVWKTLPAFLGLALIGMISGYALELYDPTAITIFDVMANR